MLIISLNQAVAFILNCVHVFPMPYIVYYTVYVMLIVEGRTETCSCLNLVLRTF